MGPGAQQGGDLVGAVAGLGIAGRSRTENSRPSKMRLRAVLSRQKRLLDVVKTLQKIAKTCTMRISSEDVVLAVNPGSLNEPQVWSSLKSVFGVSVIGLVTAVTRIFFVGRTRRQWYFQNTAN